MDAIDARLNTSPGDCKLPIVQLLGRDTPTKALVAGVAAARLWASGLSPAGRRGAFTASRPRSLRALVAPREPRRVPDPDPHRQRPDLLRRRRSEHAATGHRSAEPDARLPAARSGAEIVSFFSKLYGPYPFKQQRRHRRLGARRRLRPRVADAAELRPHPSASTVVHELAHQWFGDAVSREVAGHWLNEGFATWSEWIYDEMHGARPRRTGSTSSTRSLRTILVRGPLVPGAGRTPGSKPALPHAGLRTGGDDSAGAAGEGG